MSRGYVYVLTNFQRSILYIGVTSNLSQRIWQHKTENGSGFTKKYKATILVYAEEFDSISDAIAREKQLKRWHKEWKWNLIKKHNPQLKDWYETLKA
ncbi:MAG: GIY-YIG nuclease family protein [Balneolaceae bacterium]